MVPYFRGTAVGSRLSQISPLASYSSHNLSLFYYRYIFRYSSQMKIMDPDVFYGKYIEKDFEEYYVPHMFEKICSQYLIRKNRAGEIDPVIENIGKYVFFSRSGFSCRERDNVQLIELGEIYK